MPTATDRNLDNASAPAPDPPSLLPITDEYGDEDEQPLIPTPTFRNFREEDSDEEDSEVVCFPADSGGRPPRPLAHPFPMMTEKLGKKKSGTEGFRR